MGFKAFIFDFDNTVIYSNEDHLRSYVIASKKHGLKISEEKVRRMFGMSAYEIFRKLFPKLSEKKIRELIEEKERNYRSIVAKKTIRTIGGVRELLVFLKKKKIKTAIVSSASVRNIEVGLKRNGLGKYFKVKVGAEDVKKHKPSPDSLLKAAGKLRVRPKDCIFIGDSIYDMIAARRAGMKRFGLTTGFYKEGQMKKNGASIVFKNHTGVLRILRSGQI